MKAVEIIEDLFALADERDYSKSCDKCCSGNPYVETQKVAVAMFATPEVVEKAKDWGAQLLIVHEPIYHNSPDLNDPVDCEKRELIENSGLTLYRYHDHTHYTTPDIIAAGEFRQLALKGTLECTDVFDLIRLHLEEPITPLELARLIEKRCNIKHVRICGATNVPCKVISGMFGSPGKGAYEELKSDKSEIVLVGETTEWLLGEYARDAAQLGHKKALLILGHAGSERDGMKYTADIIKERHPQLDVKYFECGELYTYTDSE